MRYYLYRLQKTFFDALDTTNSLTIDFLPPDCANAKKGDKMIVYVSESLELLGSYEFKDLTLTRQTTFNDVTLREVWRNFDCVHTVTPTTSRLFKKKMRELTQTEFETVISQLQV